MDKNEIFEICKRVDAVTAAELTESIVDGTSFETLEAHHGILPISRGASTGGVERLQEMTDNDALREGAEGARCNHVALGAYGCTDCMNTGWLEPPLLEFMQIWDSTIKKSDLDRYGWGYRNDHVIRRYPDGSI